MLNAIPTTALQVYAEATARVASVWTEMEIVLIMVSGVTGIPITH